MGSVGHPAQLFLLQSSLALSTLITSSPPLIWSSHLNETRYSSPALSLTRAKKNSIISSSRPLSPTYAENKTRRMESPAWAEEVSFAKCRDDPLQICAPESFFDPRLESLDSFPKSLLMTDLMFDGGGGRAADDEPMAASDFDQQQCGSDRQQQLTDFSLDDLDEALLSDGSITSVLSSDEILSQMEICSGLLDESTSSSSISNYSAFSSSSSNACASDISAVPQHAAVTNTSLVNSDAAAAKPSVRLDDYRCDTEGGNSGVTCNIKQEVVEESACDYAVPESRYLVDLERVEFDIAKLKQEVDTTAADDDSMWSDFFNEDDSTEISKEYDDLLKSLLTTPVDDFDLTLNVFNNVDEEERTGEDPAVKDKHAVDAILADHCYTLPWQDSGAEVVAADPANLFLTPPNSSGDDSDPDDESGRTTSSQKISSDAKRRLSEKLPVKTVKLKHKKDLKFVFSLKVLDGEGAAAAGSRSGGGHTSLPRKTLLAGGGRSLLKKNHPPGYSPPSAAPTSAAAQLVRQALNKRAYRKRHKLNEAALAVSSLLSQERVADTGSAAGGGLFQPSADRLLKMQNDRELHNSMERQRRVELKNEFDKLKTLIPDIAKSEKVSKLNVLNSSADYVVRLERTDLKLRLKKNQLKEKQNRLMEQVKLLKAEAARRY